MGGEGGVGLRENSSIDLDKRGYQANNFLIFR